jgi:hypothetical protein
MTSMTWQLKNSHNYYDEERICENVSVEAFLTYFQVLSWERPTETFRIYTILSQIARRKSISNIDST